MTSQNPSYHIHFTTSFPFISGMSVSDNDRHANYQNSPPLPSHLDVLLCVSTSPHARAKRRIAALVEEVENLKQDRATKQRFGRAVRQMVALYTPIEDLIAENDRCCEDEENALEFTTEQNCLQRGYIELAKALPWFHDKLAKFDHEESEEMLKKLKWGADSARGDDTGTLKDLVASWVNIECHLPSLIRTDDKHHRGFMSDVCGKLLCPAEWRWDDPVVRAGIRDRTTAFIVSENSWPSFMYENYEADANNLERGLFKSKLLLMGFKAIFTSPSSANEVDGDGDGVDIIENNRCARRHSDQAKVKTCVASIIDMRKVTPRTIAYAVCQIRFALSNVTSWRTVDGDFDYQIFWNNIVDFFESPPGPAAQARVKDLLEWWTRKVFGKNHRQDLMPDVVTQMSVNALAAQRQQMEDATFDSN
ncbi:uncharacterized protein F5891DRAFT_1190619 [Suillus fuscotomentosus]|uniref:Uncharacterized protein n=1 Tax=Suillus fuscotomentosus TaxID=1912939 RepID=A0AAD4E3A4_9AGAM|nr:uncharacterized protein F5891DRAFT_1190619 [Suillus fuscotomentosus]KAG1898547.1 hypothetical protein F5891DRAFT_1190619 [Suillus fuscotomentosus]